MDVFSPPGHLIGYIEQESSMSSQNFVINNFMGEAVLLLRAPLYITNFSGNADFDVSFNSIWWLSTQFVFELEKV